ncbi:MAG: glycogen debranching protein GlgX [Planctomycetota bacterium]
MSEPIRVWPGSPTPLGATWDGEGVNFALFSEHATSVELCLFDPGSPMVQVAQLPLPERTHHVWHGYLPDVRPGCPYGFRVHGPFEPERGHRFNPNKLLLDPYARAITGSAAWGPELMGYPLLGASPGGANQTTERLSQLDSAKVMPRSVVSDPAFTWQGDRHPRTPWSRTVIYECHVKGLTALHPEVPEPLRGTYLGLCAEPVIEHLLALGVTTLELMPVHYRVTEWHLQQRGLPNYWGYSTIGFFAPDVRYATRPDGPTAVSEFRSMVKGLHRAGLEVILDVVFNHTAEGDARGPTLSFRGIDNATYYRLDPSDPRRYVDYTGCGNTLDLRHPRVLQLVLDSLRYWVTAMHVDGFRFDLAPALARDPVAFQRTASFFATIQQDPILSRVKLVAEPWDLGPGGFQVGGFPAGWAEWNARYPKTVRRFWRGDQGVVPELASRLAGSSDLFRPRDRGPFASINYVTSHDGFTLRDLVSYREKHNEANLEQGRDGESENWSQNGGVEGETENRWIRRMRARRMRSLLATLAFSQGVPMLSHGDEIGRTQRGNNNAYCQDNSLTWLHWDLGDEERALLAFTRRVLALRRENPVFRRRGFFSGDPLTEHGDKDVTWIRSDGSEMAPEDWGDPECQTLGMLIPGEAADDLDEHGRPTLGQTLLLLLNGGGNTQPFRLPARPRTGYWHVLVNTACQVDQSRPRRELRLAPRALVLLEHIGRAPA